MIMESDAGVKRVPTLFDRVAVAFSSGALTLVLSTLLWFGISSQIALYWNPVPFAVVWIVTAAMTCLGFALLVNPIANVLGGLARLFMNLF